MRRIEGVIRYMITFLNTDLGKSSSALLAGVLCFVFPQIPAYAVGSIALYYCIHRFRPVAAWIYHDLQADLNEAPLDGPSHQPPR